MQEETKWVPQGVPEPSKVSPTNSSNSEPITPTVPNDNKKNSLPWFLWVLAGCGCLAPIILAILIVVFIAAFNPSGKLNDAENSFYTQEINKIGKEIEDCIEAEKSKGTDLKKIYSLEKCANKDFLYDNRYSANQLLSDSRVLTNLGNNKICAYVTSYNYKEKQDLVTSWDSESGLSEIGKGTKICTDITEVQDKEATISSFAAKRIKEANDRIAASNVRSIAAGIEACRTNELANGKSASTSIQSCDSLVELRNKDFISSGSSFEADVTIATNSDFTQICVFSLNKDGHGVVSFNSSTGTVTKAGEGKTTCS